RLFVSAPLLVPLNAPRVNPCTFVTSGTADASFPRDDYPCPDFPLRRLPGGPPVGAGRAAGVSPQSGHAARPGRGAGRPDQSERGGAPGRDDSHPPLGEDRLA